MTSESSPKSTSRRRRHNRRVQFHAVPTVISADTASDDWQDHLNGVEWKANLRALEIELTMPYNHKWHKTLQVIVEWPTMRKWAKQMLALCLRNDNEDFNKHHRRRKYSRSNNNNKHSGLSSTQQDEFLQLFDKLQQDETRLAKLVFVEPMMGVILENIQHVKDKDNPQQQLSTTTATTKQHKNDDDDESTQKHANNNMTQHDNYNDTHNDGASSVFMVESQIWSIDAGQDVVDPPLYHNDDGDDDDDDYDSSNQQHNIRHDKTSHSLLLLDDSWEPPALQALDWQANLQALAMEMALPCNQQWPTTETIALSNEALRDWGHETLLHCINLRHTITQEQRHDFLQLFRALPPNDWRRIQFVVAERSTPKHPTIVQEELHETMAQLCLLGKDDDDNNSHKNDDSKNKKNGNHDKNGGQSSSLSTGDEDDHHDGNKGSDDLSDDSSCSGSVYL